MDTRSQTLIGKEAFQTPRLAEVPRGLRDGPWGLKGSRDAVEHGLGKGRWNKGGGKLLEIRTGGGGKKDNKGEGQSRRLVP